MAPQNTGLNVAGLIRGFGEEQYPSQDTGLTEIFLNSWFILSPGPESQDQSTKTLQLLYVSLNASNQNTHQHLIEYSICYTELLRRKAHLTAR